MPSLTALGAPSTKSLASFKPRPVIALTSFNTAILLAPADAKITFTSEASSAAASPAAGAAATATGAAADTPNFSSIAFTNSAASNKVNFSIDSKIVSTLLIIFLLLSCFCFTLRSIRSILFHKISAHMLRATSSLFAKGSLHSTQNLSSFLISDCCHSSCKLSHNCVDRSNDA